MNRLLAALALACASCRPPEPPRAAEIAASALPAANDVVAVVEQGDALFVFTHDRAAIDRGGASVAIVPAPAGGWADATAMPALDGDGSWVVARTAKGELWRITTSGDVEPIGDRLGLAPHARAMASATGALAIALDDAVAILRDRHHVASFPVRTPGALAASNDRVALRTGDAIDVWQLADQRRVDYRVPGAFAAAFAGDQLIIATPSALYVEASGSLRRLAAPAAIHQLAIAGPRAWIATAVGVYLFDHGSFVPTAITAATSDQLFGLASGDAVIAAHGTLRRLSLSTSAADRAWQASVEPIAARVCNRCHLPGGTAGVDLSTASAWHADRAQLVRRVVETRTMPPAGVTLSDADRHALAAWLSGR